MLKPTPTAMLGAETSPLSRHHKRGVVAHGVHLGQPKRLERDERAHPLVSGANKHLDRVERDAIGRQKLLQMIEDDLGQVVNLFVDLFQSALPERVG